MILDRNFVYFYFFISVSEREQDMSSVNFRFWRIKACRVLWKHAKFAINWRFGQSTAQKFIKVKLHPDNCFVIE